MVASWTSFRIAQAIGLGGALWLSGNIAALSLITVPALAQSRTDGSVSSSTLTKQWKYMYERGKSQNPPIAAAAAASFSYLAWSVRPETPLHRLVPKNSIQLYSIAALLTIGIVPYTIFTMSSTNNKLSAKARQAVDLKGSSAFTTSEDKEVGELLKRWTLLNGIRSVLPLLGSVAAFFAVLT